MSDNIKSQNSANWNNQTYIATQAQFYAKRIKDFGYSHQADGWTSKRMISNYYKLASKIFDKKLAQLGFSSGEQQSIEHQNDLAKFTLLDVGCGNCFYYDYLEELNLLKYIDYQGLELTDGAFQQVKENKPEISILKADFMAKKTLKQLKPNYNFAVAIGTFSLVDGMNESEKHAYLRSFLIRLYNLVDCGFSVMIHDDALEEENSFSRIFDIIAKENKWLVTASNAFFSNYSIFYVYKKLYAYSL